MAAKKGAGVGLFAAPVTPATAKPATASSVDEELARWVRDRRAIDVMRRLEKGDDLPTAAAAAIPPAANLTEVVTAASKVAEIHQGAAQTALQQARDARDEAQRFKEQAGASYESGLAEGRAQMTQVLQIVQEGFKTTLQLVERLHEQERASQQAQFEKTLDNLNTKLEAALQIKDREIERLKAEVESMRSRPPSPEEEVGRAILEPLRKEILAKGLQAISPPPPAGDDPQTAYQKGIVGVMVEKAKHELEEERERQRLERRHREERQEIVRELGKKAIGLVDVARDVLTGMAAPRGERHGVPGQWPANGQVIDVAPGDAASVTSS